MSNGFEEKYNEIKAFFNKMRNGFDRESKKFVCPSCGMTSINTDYCFKCDYLVTDEDGTGI